MANYSVLIIDDDIWMQRILSKTMQSYGFVDAFLASNGFDGIALAVEKVPTLIILDILMPELSGHLTLKILKRIKTTQHIPVLMVSALSDVENLGLAVKSGTAGFISKPFTRATIYDKLLDVFGKDKLEMITKGENVEPLNNYLEEIVFSSNNEKSVKSNSVEEFNVKIEPEAEKIHKDKLLQHYQDDEKRSIDEIKKMLLKSRK